jgi:hypothetical protein
MNAYKSVSLGHSVGCRRQLVMEDWEMVEEAFCCKNRAEERRMGNHVVDSGMVVLVAS